MPFTPTEEQRNELIRIAESIGQPHEKAEMWADLTCNSTPNFTEAKKGVRTVAAMGMDPKLRSRDGNAIRPGST